MLPFVYRFISVWAQRQQHRNVKEMLRPWLLLACLLARRVAEEWGMYRHSRMPRPCYPRCSAYLRRMEGTCPEGGFDKIVES